METNGYPQYKRPQDGPKFVAIKRNDKFYNDVDCRWVVPYNPYLLRKYRCHFNVQTACSIKSVKYIYKYIYSTYIRIFFVEHVIEPFIKKCFDLTEDRTAVTSIISAFGSEL